MAKLRPMRIFLDVGAHLGETVEEVAKPEYGFDRIVASEPSRTCWPALEKMAADDPRVELCRFGLFDRDDTLTLHNPGHVGASVLGNGPIDGGATEQVALVDAATWLSQNTSGEDFIVIKLNCEGSEVAIVNRWLDTGLLNRPVTVLITFDIRGFPELAGQEVTLRRRLKAAGLTNVCFSDDVMIGTTHRKRISHWLQLFGINRPELGRQEVRAAYARNFARYARRSGRWQRWEARVKQNLRYDRLPEPAKRLLQQLKKSAGLTREVDRPVGG